MSRSDMSLLEGNFPLYDGLDDSQAGNATKTYDYTDVQEESASPLVEGSLVSRGGTLS